MIKILTVLGARPQFIKAAAVSRVIASYKDRIKEVILHTGQHYDQNMSDIFFSQLEIPKPAYVLNINGNSHGAMTGKMLEEIEKIILLEKPNYLLVYGDTNSTLAGALAAAKLNVKVVHIEAGLRSFNSKMPEEINRVLTDRISNLLFCPTKQAVDNLLHEGYGNTTYKNGFNPQVMLVGDVMKDAVLYYSSRNKVELPLEWIESPYVLCTIHRAENTDSELNLTTIFRALKTISQEKKIILPIHPRTKKKIEQYNLPISENILLIEPQGYFEMLSLIKNSCMVMTDSGGLQKEAYIFEKFCVTLREETEWVELVDNRYNFIVGANYKKIMDNYNLLIDKKWPSNGVKLYGDGNASKLILEKILMEE